MRYILVTLFYLLTYSVTYTQDIEKMEVKKNFVYVLNGKKGLIDLNSKIVTNPIYEDISFCSEGLYSAGKIIGNETLYGYLNEKGEEVSSFKFYDAYPFKEGYAIVKIEKELGWTFIDKKFNTVTEKRFLSAKDFKESFAEVKLENGKWNFVKTNGDLLSNDSFDETYSFSHDFAMIKTNGKYGYIYKDGTIKIEPKFSHWREFSKHKVAVVAGELIGWKIIDEFGNIIPKDSKISVDYPYIFDNGLFKVSKTDHQGKMKYGYMNLKDEIVIPIIYDQIEGFFNHNLTGGLIGKTAYLISDNGKNTFKTKYSQIHYYYDGPVSMVYTKISNQDLKKLRIRIEDTDYEYVTNVGLMGAIDSIGNECIPTIYKDLSPVNSQIYDNYFKNQCLFTATKTNNKLKGILSDKNEILVPFIYDEINYIYNDAFLTKLNDEYSIYRTKTKKVIRLTNINIVYKTRKDFIENYLVVKDKKTGLIGLLNINGEWIIKPQFNNLTLGTKPDTRTK